MTDANTDGKDKFRNTNLEHAHKAGAILEEIVDHRASKFVTDEDRVFIDDMQAKFDQYQGREVVSERQLMRLVRIREALQRGGEL